MDSQPQSKHLKKTHTEWVVGSLLGTPSTPGRRTGLRGGVEGTQLGVCLMLLFISILNIGSKGVSSRWWPQGCLLYYSLSFPGFSFFMFSKWNKMSRGEHWGCSGGPEAAPSHPPQAQGGCTSLHQPFKSWDLPTNTAVSAPYPRFIENHNEDFPGGSVVKNLPADAGDMGSIPDQERSHMPQIN